MKKIQNSQNTIDKIITEFTPENENWYKTIAHTPKEIAETLYYRLELISDFSLSDEFADYPWCDLYREDGEILTVTVFPDYDPGAQFEVCWASFKNADYEAEGTSLAEEGADWNVAMQVITAWVTGEGDGWIENTFLSRVARSVKELEEGTARLVDDRDSAIREALEAGVSVAATARAAGLSRQAIYDIAKKEPAQK